MLIRRLLLGICLLGWGVEGSPEQLVGSDTSRRQQEQPSTASHTTALELPLSPDP
jgi:hypothetical protein